MKLGVIADCLKLPLAEAVEKAAALKLDGVQIYATGGAFSPGVLTDRKKAFYRDLLARTGLTVSALCGDMGGHGFEIAADNRERIEKTKRIVDLAAEFGSRVVTTHIGVIPSDPKEPRYRIMLDALAACGAYAHENGVTLAIETGPEPAAVLKGFIDRIPAGVGVNFDPANFVMVTGQDVVEAVFLLRDSIVHTHVKDGVMLRKTDPKIIYDCFAEGGIEALNVADYFTETPIGEGNVPFRAYLNALKEIKYDGFLTIEREAGSEPIGDIENAIAYIKNLLEEVSQ